MAADAADAPAVDAQAADSRTADGRAIDPAPLGLAAFAITTLLLNSVNAGFVSEAGMGVVVPLAVVFGGGMQILAGLLSFAEENTFGVVAFNSFGAFFVWFGSVELLGTLGVFSVDPVAFGVGFLLFGVLATYLWVGTLKLNTALSVMFVLVALTLYTAGLSFTLGVGWLTVLSGYLGILLGVVGLYISFAEVTNWCFGRDVVPLGDAPLGGPAVADRTAPDASRTELGQD